MTKNGLFMNIIAFVDFINVILAVCLGTLVYTKDPSSKLNRIFLLNCALSAYTAACEYFRFTAVNAQWAFFWHKASFLWPFFPYSLFMFVMTLTSYKPKSKRLLNYLLLIPAFIIAGVHIFTGILYKTIVHPWYGWDFLIEKNLPSVVVSVYIIVLGLISYKLIVKYYLSLADLRKRKQVVLTFLGISIPYIAGLISETLFPDLNFEAPPLNASSFLLSTVLLSAGILKYRIFIPDPLNTIEQVFATIEDYLLVFNEQREVMLASKSFLDCSGYNEDEALGKKLEIFLMDESGSFPDNLADKTGREIEIILRTKSECEIPISAIISILDARIQKGRFYLLLGRDLSERKRFENELLALHKGLEETIEIRTSELARTNIDLKCKIYEREEIESALRESEERYRNLFENSPIGIYRTTPEGKTLLANPAILSMLDYASLEELQEMNLEKEGFSEATPRSKFKNLMDIHKVLIGYETVWVKRDGTPIYCRENAKAIQDQNGETLYFEGTVENITQQKLAEEALRESENKFRTLIDTANEGVIILDLENNITFTNARMAEILACELSDLLGKSIEQFIFQEDLPIFSRHMADRLSGIKDSYEWRFHRKDHITVWVMVSGTPVYDEANNFAGAFGMFTDITERKKAEDEVEKYSLYLEDLVKKRTQELQKVNKLLQEKILKQEESEQIVKAALEKEKELSDLKSRFISIASHEFRTPLTTVLSSTELLERYGRNWDEEKYIKQTDRIKRSIKYLTKLMDDVLILSRTETGNIEFKPILLDFEKLCLQILDELKPLITGKYNVVFKYNPVFKEFYLDERLLKFILMNLLSNAIKYSVKGGSIYIDVNSENNYLIFEIRDEGIGIPEENQERLFEPFNRGTNVGTIHGTGLGMSIVKKFVDIHEGSIAFESKTGIGTKFIVKIPIKIPDKNPGDVK